MISGMSFRDSKITEVTIPDGCTTIDEYAFCSCNELTEVTIPDTVKYIGWSAFLNCDKLKQVVIPAGVETIEERAFGYIDERIFGDFVIKGCKGSAAEDYAKENRLKFVDISTTGEETVYDYNTPMGDVNGDGKVNSADIVKTAAHIKGLKSLNEAEKSCADVNTDEKIDSADIVKIAAHIKGLKKL